MPPSINCPRCHLVMMSEHPELLFFLKCPTCGFCMVNEEKKAKYPNADVNMKKLDFLKNLPIKRPE